MLSIAKLTSSETGLRYGGPSVNPIPNVVGDVDGHEKSLEGEDFEAGLHRLRSPGQRGFGSWLGSGDGRATEAEVTCTATNERTSMPRQAHVYRLPDGETSRSRQGCRR